MIGAAEVDITPAEVEGILLGGFGINRAATGQHGVLKASALAIGETVLLSVDSVGLPRATIEDVRERLEDVSPNRLMVCATHAHSTPDTIGFWGPGIPGVTALRSGRDPVYHTQLVEALARVAERARAERARTELRVARFAVPEQWSRNDRGGARFDDATVLYAIRDGERIATVLFFASHPETLWEDNTLLSADFPGVFRAHSRALSGGVPLYVSGPLGGMLTPNVAPDATLDERIGYAESLGRYLAEACEAHVATSTPLDPDALTHTRRALTLPNENWRFRLMHRLGIIRPYPHVGAPRWRDSGALEVEVHQLAIGAFEVLTAPGEVTPELARRVLGRRTARYSTIACLCGDELGYLMTPEQLSDPNYGYEASMSLGLGATQTLEAEWRRA